MKKDHCVKKKKKKKHDLLLIIVSIHELNFRATEKRGKRKTIET